MSSPGLYDKGPYYFLRVPVAQFEQIGRYKVSGLWTDRAFGSTKPEEYIDAIKGVTQTKGWTVKIKEGNTMDGYVYCKYVPDSFFSGHSSR
jgi:hypothetical protein